MKKNRIDRIAGRIAKRGLSLDASPFEKRVAKAMQIVADAKDEEIWRTSENGKHYQLETETGEITKGLGGRKNGTKIQPKASRAGGSGGGEGSGTNSSSEKGSGKSAGSRQEYKRTKEPHKITLTNPDGRTFTTQSYGEGWKDGYHVRQTDDVGGEYIDEGEVGGVKIGSDVLDQVRAKRNDSAESAKVVMAHKYPNGRVDYTVEVKDKYSKRSDGITMSAEDLKKPTPSSKQVKQKENGSSEFGELETTYRDGTKSYKKKDVDLSPEEHKEWMGAMSSWVKSEATKQLETQGYKRRDIDISIDPDKGTAFIKTWKDDPKSPSGIVNEYFNVKLKGTRTTNLRPDGSKKQYANPDSVVLEFAGSELY